MLDMAWCVRVRIYAGFPVIPSNVYEFISILVEAAYYTRMYTNTCSPYPDIFSLSRHG